MTTLKNHSLNLPEQDYHNYPAWSYSQIARYAKDGFSAIAHLDEHTSPTTSMEFGSLFDCIMTKGHTAEEEYFVSSSTVPDAERKAFDFILTRTDMPFNEIPPTVLASLLDECQYYPRWKFETRLQHLTENEAYYQNKRLGKKTVSETDWNDAMQMADAIHLDEYLKNIFGTRNSLDVEYLYQLQFAANMTLDDGRTVHVKIMPDLLVVNHKDMTIQPVDLKTSSCPAYEFADNFTKFRYDIQASLYTDVLQTIMLDSEYAAYTLLPYLFTDISRTDKVPVTYQYDPREASQENGLCFFSKDKTYQYKGWRQLLGEILDYKEANAVVPSNITTTGPNDIVSILSNK